MTTTIAKFLVIPIFRKKRLNRSFMLDTPPPPTDVKSEMVFGPYSWKATVNALDQDGVIDRTFIGYSQNMNITSRTQVACDRYKLPGTTCGEVEMAMKGGGCDEVIFIKPKGGKIRPIL